MVFLAELTTKDRQAIGSALDAASHRLKLRKRDLASAHIKGAIDHTRAVSGQTAINGRIRYLQSLKRRIGVGKGYKVSQQPQIISADINFV